VLFPKQDEVAAYVKEHPDKGVVKLFEGVVHGFVNRGDVSFHIVIISSVLIPLHVVHRRECKIEGRGGPRRHHCLLDATCSPLKSKGGGHSNYYETTTTLVCLSSYF